MERAAIVALACPSVASPRMLSIIACISAVRCSASVRSLRADAMRIASEATMMGPPRFSSRLFIFSRKLSEYA